MTLQQHEDWKTYKRAETEIKKGLTDEVHEFLTKVFNVYLILLPSEAFKQLEVVRDKLIQLTAKFRQDVYNDFCDSFSKVYRALLFDRGLEELAKRQLTELVQKTNTFFASKNLPNCVRELRYYGIKVKVLFKEAPLTEATVVLEAEGRVVSSSKTLRDGMATLEVPEGKYNLYVFKSLPDGTYIYEERVVSVPQETEILINVSEVRSKFEIERRRGGRPLIKEVGGRASQTSTED